MERQSEERWLLETAVLTIIGSGGECITYIIQLNLVLNAGRYDGKRMV